MPYSFPADQIMRRMVVENPWWSNGKIFSDYADMTPRMFLAPFVDTVETMPSGRAVVLLGPRRVGKTVMVFHAIRHLIDERGVDPRKIIYLASDSPLYGGLQLEEMVELAVKATKAEASARLDGYYIFFDEIQYVCEWERQLKVLCDFRRGARIVVSGSAAAALKAKSDESGVGRFTHFSLPPLLFCEYLKIIGADNLIARTTVDWFGSEVSGIDTININELNRHLIDYVNFGGYPEVVVTPVMRSNPGKYIKEDIVDKVLMRDLPGLYGITDTRNLYRLFVHLVYRTGQEFSYEDLSKESGIKKETLKRYIDYLRSAFLIDVLHKVDENARRFQRVTSFKIYLTNPSLYCAIFAPAGLNDSIIGPLMETAYASQLSPDCKRNLYYANWKKGRQSGEVDFVMIDPMKQKPVEAVETKWSDRYANQPGELKSLLTFMSANNMPRALVSTSSIARRTEVGDRVLQFVPLSLLVYQSGFDYVSSDIMSK